MTFTYKLDDKGKERLLRAWNAGAAVGDITKRFQLRNNDSVKHIIAAFRKDGREIVPRHKSPQRQKPE
jgi:hypothetical protein